MDRSESAQGTQDRHSDRIKVRLGSTERVLSEDQLFVFGHVLLNGGHGKEALHVFKILSEHRPKDRRVKVMLARAEASVEHFDLCHSILESIFADHDDATIDELHSAFVYHRLGMIHEAVKELAKAIKEHPDMPTACLCLGDEFAAEGIYDKAKRCWELAIQRDSKNGPVAKAAARQLEELRRHPVANEPNS